MADYEATYMAADEIQSFPQQRRTREREIYANVELTRPPPPPPHNTSVEVSGAAPMNMDEIRCRPAPESMNLVTSGARPTDDVKQEPGKTNVKTIVILSVAIMICFILGLTSLVLVLMEKIDNLEMMFKSQNEKFAATAVTEKNLQEEVANLKNEIKSLNEKTAATEKNFQDEIDKLKNESGLLSGAAAEATSCEDLKEIYGVSKTGTYLLKGKRSEHAVYNFCDFTVRQGVSSCYNLRRQLGGNLKNGNYVVTVNGTDQQSFAFCDFTLPQDFPTDCKSVKRENAKIRQSIGGVFDIYPESRERSVEVFCDLETDGDGWTVFQRRMDGSVEFYRGWNDYVNGFGEKDKEFWLGLEAIHQLTKNGNYELRVDLMDWAGNISYAKYGTFAVGSGNTNYTLSVGSYSGVAGDSLDNQNGRQFSTKDADNDVWYSHCAQSYRGAWWYTSCHYSHLNGIYYRGPKSGDKGISWYYWKNKRPSLKFTEMKFRKK